jgi:prevent-host-death family protein
VRPLFISEDFVPISEFKAQASEWLRKAAASGAPVVVTQSGKPAGVLLSPRAYDMLAHHAHVVAAIEEGLADVEAGRVIEHDVLVREMKARYGRRPRRAPRKRRKR